MKKISFICNSVPKEFLGHPDLYFFRNVKIDLKIQIKIHHSKESCFVRIMKRKMKCL